MAINTNSSYYYYWMPRGRKKQPAKAHLQKESEVNPEIYQSPNSHVKPPVKKQDQWEESNGEGEQVVWEQEEEGQEGGKRQNSLTILTKRFTKLIKSKQNFILDINQATKELGVQKRRIYDITNVLEGIGYIQKIHKNKMKWVGGTMDYQVARQVLKLDSKIEQLAIKNRQVDEDMLQLTYKLKKETEDNKHLNFFLESDLRQILQNAEGNPSSMLVIKAIQGSVMELKENKVIIEKQGSEGDMLYLTLSKKDRDDCFSIIK